MKLILKKIILLFFITTAPFAHSEFDPNPGNINELITSYPPLTIEFQGQSGKLFIADNRKSVYFLTNQGKDLDYISDLPFDDIISVFLYQHPKSKWTVIYVLGRKKRDTDEVTGFDYNFTILDLTLDKHNILRIIHKPSPSLYFKSLNCFYGIDHGKKKNCEYKDEQSFKAYLAKDK